MLTCIDTIDYGEPRWRSGRLVIETLGATTAYSTCMEAHTGILTPSLRESLTVLRHCFGRPFPPDLEPQFKAKQYFSFITHQQFFL